jgi:alkylhydroperoxidase family enzyme
MSSSTRFPRSKPRWRGAEVESAMPRVREIDDPGDDPILQEIFARERELVGAPFNTTKIQAHRPGILKAAKQLSVAVEKSGLLGAELLAFVYLRVALINGCPF